MVAVVRLLVLLKRRHERGKDWAFNMIVAGSQIVLFQPGYQVKRHTSGVNYGDELPLNKLPERKASHKQFSHIANVASI